MATTRSDLAARAAAVIPGGVNSGQRRVPGLKLHDDRVIRLLETLLHPGGFVRNWTSRELHTPRNRSPSPRR